MNISGPHRLLVPDYPATSVEVTVSLQGLVVGVGVVYELTIYSSAVDLSVIETNDNQPDQEILSLASAATDGWFFPTVQHHDTDGSAIANEYALGVPVAGSVTLSLTGAQPGDVVYITIKTTM